MSKSVQWQVIRTWLVILFASLMYGGWQTWQTYSQFNAGALAQAKLHLHKAAWSSRLASGLTLGLIPDVELWKDSLVAGQATAGLLDSGQHYLALALNAHPDSRQAATDLASQLPELNNKLASLNQDANHCLDKPCLSLLKFSHRQWLSRLSSLSQTGLSLSQLTAWWLSNSHQATILLQNSEELRATGGFIGSFIQLKADQGQVGELKFYDIYDADGQYLGYQPAPPGIDLYLSQGKGLRLPDANWDADFAQSSQKINELLSEGGFGQSDLVAAVNLDLIEQLLVMTGPVFVSDFGITVTPQNLSTVARADRATFFAGSQAKKNFLQALFTQLKLKLTQLDSRQQQELLSLLIESARVKDLQVYSLDSPSQTLLESLQLAGLLSPASHSQVIKLDPELSSPASTGQLYLYLVESNVGINKANQNISRYVKLEIQPGKTRLELELTNFNQQTPLRYLNYQRLITLPEVEIQSIQVDGQPVSDWSEQIITNAHQQEFKQIGFLVEVPPEQTRSITIELAHPQLGLPAELTIGKQAGLPPTSYHVQYNEQQLDFTLIQDTLITTQP